MCLMSIEENCSSNAWAPAWGPDGALGGWPSDNGETSGGMMLELPTDCMIVLPANSVRYHINTNSACSAPRRLSA